MLSLEKKTELAPLEMNSAAIFTFRHSLTRGSAYDLLNYLRTRWFRQLGTSRRKKLEYYNVCNASLPASTVTSQLT